MNDTNPLGRQGIAALLSRDSGPASRLIDLRDRIVAPMRSIARRPESSAVAREMLAMGVCLGRE
jgi:hypothetical protein